ncbi:hypothetical protein KCP70_12390 [Salmonella enterica subsp. enterica]|nr:hypothetical protein KCP70_12390 [Salmonella enterica subsp. enterica]
MTSVLAPDGRVSALSAINGAVIRAILGIVSAFLLSLLVIYKGIHGQTSRFPATVIHPRLAGE